MKSSLKRKVTAVFLTLTLVIAASFAVPNASNGYYFDGDVTIKGHFGFSYVNTVINGDVYVVNPSLRIDNLIINGDLYITANKPDKGVGTVYLNNVEVAGDIVVTGSTPVRCKGYADTILMSAGANFTLSEGIVNYLYITEDADHATVKVNKGGVINRAVIETSCTLKGDGKILKAMVPLYGDYYVEPGLVPNPN